MKYQQSHQTISSFLERCEKEKLTLPENPYEAMQEVSTALKEAHGKEEEAMNVLKKRFAGGNKRSHAEAHNGDNDDDDDDSDNNTEQHEDMPQHKRARLIEEARNQPAAVKENQKLVDAFVDYAQVHLDRGHTGKFVSHVRAANYIRDYDQPIKSGQDAMKVGYVGRKMAGQIDEVLKTGKFKDETPDMNVTRDYDHFPPPLVAAIRESPAKRKENQKIVDVLTEYAEGQLKYGNSGKGTSHLRAAKQIHDTDILVDSGFRAQSQIGYIGSHLADKIDQILQHGKIVHDDETSGPHRIAGERAPIVQDLIDNPAKVHANQKIVDALRDYGDAHLRGGTRGTGISHLRAAVQIRNCDFAIKSGGDAQKIGYVGKQVAKKVDQILRHGHADSDDDYDENEEETADDDEEEEEEEEEGDDNDQHYGKPHAAGHPTPLVVDVRNRKAKCPENQAVIDALADYGENKLSEGDSGRGVTYLRAARELIDCGEVVTSGMQAKKVAMVGNKVATLIDETLKKKMK